MKKAEKVNTDKEVKHLFEVCFLWNEHSSYKGIIISAFVTLQKLKVKIVSF